MFKGDCTSSFFKRCETHTPTMIVAYAFLVVFFPFSLLPLIAMICFDAVMAPLSSLFSGRPPRPKTSDDLVQEANRQLEQIQKTAQGITDPDIRNAILADAEIKHRERLAQIFGDW